MHLSCFSLSAQIASHARLFAILRQTQAAMRDGQVATSAPRGRLRIKFCWLRRPASPRTLPIAPEYRHPRDRAFSVSSGCGNSTTENSYGTALTLRRTYGKKGASHFCPSSARGVTPPRFCKSFRGCLDLNPSTCWTFPEKKRWLRWSRWSWATLSTTRFYSRLPRGCSR